MAKSHFSIKDYAKCLQCAWPMIGVMHSSVRDTCEQCGGYAKRDSVVDLQERLLNRARTAHNKSVMAALR